MRKRQRRNGVKNEKSFEGNIEHKPLPADCTLFNLSGNSFCRAEDTGDRRFYGNDFERK